MFKYSSIWVVKYSNSIVLYLFEYWIIQMLEYLNVLDTDQVNL